MSEDGRGPSQWSAAATVLVVILGVTVVFACGLGVLIGVLL